VAAVVVRTVLAQVLAGLVALEVAALEQRMPTQLREQ
jgi:hypothetical protein